MTRIRHMACWVVGAACVGFNFIGACGDAGESSGPGGPGGNGSGGSGSGLTGNGTPDPGSPHTPATGCDEGFDDCGEVCADLMTDGRHCGGCGVACELTQGCVDGECIEGGDGCDGLHALCGGACISPRDNAAHCGSCDNRCADDALCLDSECVDGGGDGSSCESPMFWDFAAEEEVGFHFAPSLTDLHTFECGPLDPIPTRWFRITASKSDTDIDVGGDVPDDYILEVFDECPSSSVLACSDNQNGQLPETENVPTTEGQSYWIAVGLEGEWSGQPATIRGDH